MLSARRFTLVLLLVLAIGLGSVASGDNARRAVAGGAPFAPGEATEVPDPFPIARIRANEEQLAEAIEHADRGPLVRLPRTEFESRVRKAALVAAEARDPSRLVEASYAASLSGSNLTGDARWTILNPRAQPAFLSLEPLKLAVQSPTWADGSDAILGSFGSGFPEGSGLWVPPGRQNLKLKWSAAGTGFLGERRFELRVPPCSTAVLDLELPADRTPSNPAEVLLTGPFPVPSDLNLRSWRFRFGNRSLLEFGVRGPTDPDSGLTIAALAAKYELAPGQTTCTFEYDLRSTRAALAEWIFALSPGLTVVEVAVNDASAWRVDPATRQLHVGLRQPAAGVRLVITAAAVLPPRGQNAALPTARPVNSIARDERLELRVPPDLELVRLDAADYRIADSTLSPDGTRVTTLVGALLPAGTNLASRRAPSIRVSGTDPEFTTNEGLEWRIDAGRMNMEVRVGVHVRRGPLFRLEFRTPPGFTLERLASAPDDAVSYSGPTPTGFEVEFANSLAAGQRVELRIELRGPQVPSQGSQVAFPRFAPVGAAERDGWVSFSPGPAWSLVPLPAPGAIAAADLDWPDGAPADAAVVYAYRGLEPAGILALAPVQPVFAATLESRFEGNGAQANATTRIALKVAAGNLTGLVLYESSARSERRTFKLLDGSNAIASTTEIDRNGIASLVPPIGPTAALSIPASRSFQPSGTFWIVQFVRPVTGEVTLESAAMVPLDRTNRPLLTVLGATEGDWKSNRANPADPSPVPTAQPRGWVFEGLHLITLCAESHTLVVFGGTLQSRGGSVLPVGLPAGAEVRAACVGGYWLDPGRCQASTRGEDAELRLPIPAGTDPVRFEVRYRLPRAKSALAGVRSPEPILPGEGYSFARWWAFPRGVAAAWPLAMHDRSRAREWPILLGEPLENPAGELTVCRASVDAIQIAPTKLADAFGMALAALLGGLAWVGIRRSSRFVGLALLTVLFLGGAAYWLGPEAWERAAFPPLVAALVGAGALAAIRGWRSPTVPVVSQRSVAALALLVASIPAISVHAQTVASADRAIILAGPEPDRESVVVPRSTLDRIEKLQQRPEPSFVIRSATYIGRLEDGLARFEVKYVVQAFPEGEASLQLPLAEARLERASVDGKPAQPTAVRPDLYSLPIAGRGRHEIDLRFAVPVATTGPEREVKFGIPEVSDCRMAFAAPPSARQIQAVGRRGDQKTNTEADRIQLDAELGGIRSVHLRWREGPGGAATVSAREGCIWDVSERGHELTACYLVRIDTGSTATLRFDLPVGLDPIRVSARSLDSILAGSALRDWSLGKEAGGFRPLRIDLNGPTDGRLAVILECVPRGAPTRQPVLRFPRLVEMNRTEAIYGLRANGVAIESIGRTGVIDFAADAFARDFASLPDLHLNPANPVVAFSPRTGDAAELRPAIRSGPELPAVTMDVCWNVGPQLATGRGTIKWTAAEAVSSLDFTLSAILAEVRSPDVAGWAQTAGRVQVWFRKPLKEGQVEWVATTAPAMAPLAFEPPIPVGSNCRIASQIVRLHPADGWGVRVERDKGWTSVLTNERAWTYQSEGALAPPRLQLFPAAGGGSSRGFGIVELAGTEVSYRTTMEAAIGANRPNHLVLRARGLPAGANAALDVPPGTLVRERLNEESSREWDLDVPAGASTTFRAALIVRLPVKESVALPTIDLRRGGTLPSPLGVVRWIGVTGAKRDVRWEGATPATSVELTVLPGQWPGEVDRLRRAGGSIWSTPTGSAVLQFPVVTLPARTPPPAKPAPSTVASSSPNPATASPVLAALGWCGTAIGVLVLFVRSPRVTWPEQVGLLGGLFGYAVAGGWVAGVAVYAIARIAWLIGARTRR